MLGRYLAVNNVDEFFYQVPAKADQRDFRGVAFVAEHAFAKKYCSQRYTVKAAGEAISLPAFDRVRDTDFVKMNICALHFVRYPGLDERVIVPYSGTCVDDPFECQVAGDPISAPSQGFSQASRHMDLARVQHGPRVGAPPEQRLALVVPWEYPVRIRGNQCLSREVTTDSQQPVGIGEFRVGEAESGIAAITHAEFQVGVSQRRKGEWSFNNSV